MWKRFSNVLSFFLIGIKLTDLICKLETFYYFQTKNLKFDSCSNFILSLILFEATCYFRNKAIFWIVFNRFSNWYFRTANYTHFIVYYLRTFGSFKFRSYCLLVFFIWNDSLILRQNIFENRFYPVSRLSDLVCKLHPLCFPFLHILFGIYI